MIDAKKWSKALKIVDARKNSSARLSAQFMVKGKVNLAMDFAFQYDHFDKLYCRGLDIFLKSDF